MQLSTTFRQALPLIFVLALTSRPLSAANPSTDNGSDGGGRRFPPHEMPANTEGDLNRVIVHYRNSQGLDEVVSKCDKVHKQLQPQKAVAVGINPKVIEALRNNPNIASIEVDPPRYLVGLAGVRGGEGGEGGLVPSSAELSIMDEDRRLVESVPYGVEMVQADQLSQDVNSKKKVCIIDSGYSFGHEDLQTTSVNGFPDGWDSDLCMHGTHVAGTIAALGNNNAGVRGVIDDGQLDLHIVKVFAGENCAWSYASDLIHALNECKANGAKIISMSLGGSQSSVTESQAFQGAYDAGILSVAAAGNSGTTALSYPASYESVVSVGAVDSSGTIASFSQKNSQVELSAPGVNVRSTVGMGKGSEDSVSVGGVGYEAIFIEGSPTSTTATGALVNCGLGTSTCPEGPGQVCLIQRGDISFADKVLACQAGGGVAAVIFNNVDGLFEGTLGGVGTSIPSVGISKASGESALDQLGQNAIVSLQTGNYLYYDGTSMATPHVSGVAALVWSHHPTCRASDIRNALTTTAQDKGTVGRDTEYGYGIIQAHAAKIFLDNNPPCGGGGAPTAAPVIPPPAPTAVPPPVPPPTPSTCLPGGAQCSEHSDCCSSFCRWGNKTCRN